MAGSYRAIAPAADLASVEPRQLNYTGLSTIPRQVLSKDEWEELKPIIRNLYIEKKWTFRRIVTFLCDHHAFAPTKRQFDTRVAQWGFKKNASRNDRRKILESNGPATVGRSGKLVSEKSRLRWQKENELQAIGDSDINYNPNGSLGK